MELELRHLRAFVAVAQERHFGRAAKRLHVAQPPLSRQIRRLEQELGTELFDRSLRPIRLTAAGVAFLEDAERTLHQAQRAVDRVRRAGRGELGQLSIGAMPWAYNGVVPAVVRAFRSRSPDVSLELSTLAPAEQAEALQKGRLDVGFAALPRWLADAHVLKFEAIVEEPMVAIVPDQHRFSKQSQVALHELSGEPRVCISRAVAPELADAQATLFRERGLTPTVLHEASDVQGLLGLVAAGVGVALHIESVANLRRRGVTFVALEPELPTMTLSLIWRRDDDRELVRAFVETARQVARSLPTD